MKQEEHIFAKILCDGTPSTKVEEGLRQHRAMVGEGLAPPENACTTGYSSTGGLVRLSKFALDDDPFSCYDKSIR